MQNRNSKYFGGATAQDYTIYDNDGVVGHIRIKPSGVAWKAKGTHSKWLMLSVEQFSELAMKHGKEQKK